MEILEGNTVRHCRNCTEPLSSDALYCPKCSQKYTDGRVPVWQLFKELIESFFNFDSKIFRTLGALFVPGKLTIEYFKGRHLSYVPPVRIFLIMAIFHFAVIGFFGFDGIKFNFIEEQNDLRQAVYRATFLEELDTIQQKIAKDFKRNRTVQLALDSLRHQFKDVKKDSIEIGYLDFHRDFSIKGKELNIAQHDIYEPYDEIFKNYKINGFWEKLQVRQSLRLITENSSFSGYLLGKLIWMVVLMMPALSLVLKLLYIRRRKYFVEHLVFSFHYHAFAFLVVGIGILLSQLEWFKRSDPDKDASLPFVLAFLAVIVYLFIAMRRVYQQHWFKTFIKYNLLNFSYIIIFTLSFAITLIVSVLLF